MRFTKTFSQIYAELDWLLQQRKDIADAGSADKFRYLPTTDVVDVFNHIMREMVNDAAGKYEKELTIRFYDPQAWASDNTMIPDYSERYLDIDVRGDCLDDTYLYLPHCIHDLMQYYSESDKWRTLYNTSQSNRSLYSPEANVIFREDGYDAYSYDGTEQTLQAWEADTEIRAFVVQYPQLFKENVTLTSTDFEAEANSDITSGDVQTLVSLSETDFADEFDDFALLERGDKVLITVDGAVTEVRVLYATVDRVSGQIQWILDWDTTGGAGTVTQIEYSHDDIYIRIPENFLQLFQYRVKERVYSRMNKAMSTYEYSKMMRLNKSWETEAGRVEQKSSLSFEGHNFGRR